MQTIQTPQQPVSPSILLAAENRIIARVVLQVWGGRKGNDAVVDSEKEVDVTDAILLLDHDLLIGLQDSTNQADEIGHAHVNHSGPLEVYVTGSICHFFGVDSMEDITLAALEEARRVVNPKRPEYVRTTVQMEVTAKVLPGGDPGRPSTTCRSRSRHRRKTSSSHARSARGQRPAVPARCQLRPIYRCGASCR